MLTPLGAPQTRKSDEIDVGEQIRLVRKQRGWSLTDAAQRLGVGRSTLAKVEASTMSPTIGLLQKIARGLDVDITVLISRQNSVPAVGRMTITRAGQGQRHNTTEHAHEVLSADLAAKRMTPFRSRIIASEPAPVPDLYRHDAEEFIFVLEGQVTLYSEHYAPADLGVGDSVYLDGRMGHCFVARGGADAVVLFVLAQEH